MDFDKTVVKLFDAVLDKVLVIVNTGEFKQSDLEPVLMAVIETVQVVNHTHKLNLTGPQKRELALATAERLLEYLHEQRVIDEVTMQRAVTAVRFAGPALMDGLKALYKKIHAIDADIQQNGCAGCCRRNF